MDEALNEILKELSLTDPRVFMELSYIAIMQEPEYAIELGHDKKEKLESLRDLIAFFESEERYEECANLLKILKEIDARNQA